MMAALDSNIVPRPDGSLNMMIGRRPLCDSCCHTVHLVLDCPSATGYSPRVPYTAVRAWFCGQPAVPGNRRCARHWFSQYVLYAADTQPIAIANTDQQLAEVLHVPAVYLLDANTQQPLDTSSWANAAQTPTASNPRAPAAAFRAIQAAEGATSAQQLASSAVSDMEVELPGPAAHYSDHAVTLEVPKPVGNWVQTACAALFTVLDVDSKDVFEAGHRHTILQNCRCGNESGKQVFCSKHRKSAHIFLLAKNGELMWAVRTLPELAQVLAVSEVQVNDQIGDLESKLAAETALAAGDNPSAGAGASGSSNSSAAPAQQQATAAMAQPVPMPLTSNVPPVLRLHLTQQQIEALTQQQQGADQLKQQQEAARLAQIQQGYFDVHLAMDVHNVQAPLCLGMHLRLGVANLQELAISSGPLAITAGRRCGNLGGLKRCCKQHRSSLILLTDQQGNALPGAANLDGLASILKVASIEVLDSRTLQPLEEYQQLPTSIRWQVAPDKSTFTIWMPQDNKDKPQGPEQAAQHHQQQGLEVVGRHGGGQCIALEIGVAMPQGQVQALGTSLTVLSVTRCVSARAKGPSCACRRHQPSPLVILHQGPQCTQPTQQACRNLGELALCLGVQKVEILDSDTGQAIEAYRFLVQAPVQLPMPAHMQQQQQQLTSLAPPSLQVQPLQGWSSAAAGSSTAAAAVRMDVDQSQQQLSLQIPGAAPPAAPAAVSRGNCTVEVIHSADAEPADGQTAGAAAADGRSDGSVQGYVIKVPAKPAGAATLNPCRALDVTVTRVGSHSGSTPGHSQWSNVSVNRCGNEAGGKSRCKPHNDAAVQLLAAAAPSMQQQQQQPLSVSTILARLHSSYELAQHLGVRAVQLQCMDTAADLGDVSSWSLSSATGTAAKVQLPAATGGDGGAAAAAAPPAAMTIPLPEALRATLGNVVLPASMQARQQQQQVNALFAAAAVPAAVAGNSNSTASMDHASVSLSAGLLQTPTTSMTRLGLDLAPNASNAGSSVPAGSIVLQSSALAASIAAGNETPAVPAGVSSLEGLVVNPGFETSRPARLAILSGVFKAPQPSGGT